ncbi:MAG: DUF3795 domain-containing protein [Armatimonadetes bacterium]|nr:DUF3795 domain-containing protein [Armatimonadota bacterium]
MKKIIACCGIVCIECPAYIAFKNDDDELRKKTAKQWSEEFKADIKPENINCVGCIVKKGIHFSHCFECEIRKCCQEKNIDNCAICNLFPCQRISDFFKFVPTAKTVLEDIHNK